MSAAQLTEELVWELFTQSGPVVNVYLPKDRVTSQHQGYGFVEFKSEDDADYVRRLPLVELAMSLSGLLFMGPLLHLNGNPSQLTRADADALHARRPSRSST